MKKSLKVLVLTMLLLLVCSTTAFAGQWKQEQTGWWYQEDDGSYPVNTWKEIDGSWYFFEPSGYIAVNRWEGNYYLSASGAMLVNTITPDGYYVGADGAWIPDGGITEVNTVNTENVVANTGDFYILNTNSKKFHYPACNSVERMSAKNKREFTGSRDEVIGMGYDPCANCNP